MGHNSNYQPETSNPVIWALALLVATFALLWGFVQFIAKGEATAANMEKTVVEKVAAGPGEPDHAALLDAVLADEAGTAAKGARIYKRACTSCHGEDGGAPKLAGARNYLTEAFKNGSDMYGIYKTISQGYGSMAAQKMDPADAYAVAEYIRESFAKQNSLANYEPLTPEYIAAGGWPEAGAGGAVVEVNVNELKYGPVGVPVAAVMLENAVYAESAAVAALRVRLLQSHDKAIRALGEGHGNGAKLEALLAAGPDQQAFLAVLNQPGASIVPADVLIDEQRLAALHAVVVAQEQNKL
jgi:mono/diheme cytochrome c family protein